ncbi:MFS transporter [Agrococcus sp. ARC_14]|uniref:MFS transporter n=1 Tax=Agrococcus sp. ARC_14 TaxID=2919927 RepID=UPI001F06C939|nr:MHS family MFS transporter [Agrococcus sp. ARC_14]
MATASLVGTTIEWYDYYIYGTATVLVFNHQFFPSLDPTAATLAALATFSVAYIARPLGGALFGHFGDKLGRKKMLVLSVLLMGAATLAVGLLPDYNAIGILAPILLVLFRFLQGFAVGGEWGGAVLVALEHAPARQRAFYASFPQVGVPLGTFLSAGTFALITMLPAEDVQTWAWRIPFFASVALVFVALWIRLQVTETPEFLDVQQDKREQRVPALEILKKHKRSLITGMLSLLPNSIVFYLLTVFLISWGPDNVGITSQQLFIALMISAGIAAPLLPMFATLADRFGVRRILMIGAALIAAYGFPLFWLFETGNFWAITFAMALGIAVLHNLYYGVLASFMASLYPAEVRYSGTALSYQLGQIISSAPVPILATLFASGGSTVGVSIYVIVAGLGGLVAVALAPKILEEQLARDTSTAPSTADGSDASVERSYDSEARR